MPNRKELDGLLGMYEMEVALEIMLQRSEQKGISFEKLTVGPDDFILLQSLIGFCHLLVRRLVVPAIYPNSEFMIGQSLVDRMRIREVWKDLPNPPTMEERVSFLANMVRQ